jgi:hypothetical protein
MMQTDVKQAHLNQSGFLYTSRTRVKGLSIRGSATLASQVDLFDSNTVPVSATYAQTGYVITVTKVAHGLVTGQSIGIAFTVGTGGGASNGNYVITKLTADTFTVTSINSISITAGAICVYVVNGGWLLSLDLIAGDTYSNYQLLPGEGLLAQNGVYATLTNLSAISIYYG